MNYSKSLAFRLLVARWDEWTGAILALVLLLGSSALLSYKLFSSHLSYETRVLRDAVFIGAFALMSIVLAVIVFQGIQYLEQRCSWKKAFGSPLPKKNQRARAYSIRVGEIFEGFVTTFKENRAVPIDESAELQGIFREIVALWDSGVFWGIPWQTREALYYDYESRLPLKRLKLGPSSHHVRQGGAQ